MVEIKEAIKQNLENLSQEQLTQVADFISFLKYQSRCIKLRENQSKIAALYSEFAEEDRQLAQHWQYLVQRPHPWRRQLYIKGRKLLASTIWQDMILNKMSPEETADNWNLPLDAIYEVINYCQTNQQLLEIEAEEERYRLQEKGVSLEPTTAS